MEKNVFSVTPFFSLINQKVVCVWTSVNNWLWLEIGESNQSSENASEEIQRGRYTFDSGGSQWRVIQLQDEKEVCNSFTNKNEILSLITGEKIEAVSFYQDEDGFELEVTLHSQKQIQFWLEQDFEISIADNIQGQFITLDGSGNMTFEQKEKAPF